MAILQVKGMKSEEHTCREEKIGMASANSVRTVPLHPRAKAPLLSETPVLIPCFPVTAGQPRRKSTWKTMDTFVLEMK